MAAAVAAAVAGIVGDIHAGPTVASSQANAAYGTLSAAVFVTASLMATRFVIVIVAITASGHLYALNSRPVEAAQGAVLLIMIAIGAFVIANQLRAFANDADIAEATAVQAERGAAGALIHDGLSLLSLTARSGQISDSLRAAARAAASAQQMWLKNDGDSAPLAEMLRTLRGQFPDLPLRIDVDALVCAPPMHVRDTAIRAVRTLLTNTRVHAHAGSVWLYGAGDDAAWTIEVSDDGRGFDDDTTPRRDGLTTYTRDALSAAGMQFSITSTPSRGTVARIGATLATPSVPHDTSALAAAERLLYRGRGLLLIALWLMVVLAVPKIAQSYRDPMLVVALAIAVAVALTALSLRTSWTPSTSSWAGALLVSIAAGTAITYLAGSAAADGSNVGITLVAWASELLALHLAGRAWWCLLPALPLVPGVAAESPIAAFGIVTWLAVAILIASHLSGALRQFGRDTDDALVRILAAERRIARGAVRAQSAALTNAAVHSAHCGGDEQQEIEGSAIPLTRSDLRTVNERTVAGIRRVTRPAPGYVAEALCDAVAEILGGPRYASDRTTDIRAHGENRYWEVSLMNDQWNFLTASEVEGSLSHSVVAALCRYRIALRTRDFPGGGSQIRFTGRS